MRTVKNPDNTYTCELRINGVLCICEANRRREARRGALEMACQRKARMRAQ